jgi:Flp pilus assembly CpaF family ATPase
MATVLIQELEEQLKERPVLLAFLKPLFEYLTIRNLVEVNVNRPGELRLESATEGVRFVKVKHLDFKYWLNLCHILANGNGSFFHPEKQPRVSVELPGGHRFEAMVGDAVKQKISVSIRLKREIQLMLEDFGLKDEKKDNLISMIEKGANIIISGGTSSGKTTFLNCLLNYVPKDRRILSVEDTYELNIEHYDKSNYLVSRNENNPTIGYPQMIDHLMRSRPDMIVCGELSMANALPILRMLNSGHAGFLCTAHADSPTSLIDAIRQNILMSGTDIPKSELEQLLYGLLDAIVQLHRDFDGKRRVTEIFCPKTGKQELIYQD